MKRLVAVCAIVAGLASCASPRNGLNTSSGACFRALPAAEAAVRRKGALVGVRKVTTTELVAKVPQASRIDQKMVCAIAFRGAYLPGDVVDADPPGPGAFAVVVVDAAGARVVSAFVLDALPLRFRHRV